MNYHYEIGINISIILLIILLVLKKKPLLWTILLCLATIPFSALISGAIYSTINGSGLVGDIGGIDSGLFVIVIWVTEQWYIFIPSLVLLIISFYKVFIRKRRII